VRDEGQSDVLFVTQTTNKEKDSATMLMSFRSRALVCATAGSKCLRNHQAKRMLSIESTTRGKKPTPAKEIIQKAAVKEEQQEGSTTKEWIRDVGGFLFFSIASGAFLLNEVKDLGLPQIKKKKGGDDD
jgi:hypothetical protein